jgi:hypothetical protein
MRGDLVERDVSDADWAWLAGFIDGDGCITTNGHSRAWIIKVTQKSITPLAHINRVWGIGVIGYKGSGPWFYEWRCHRKLEVIWILDGIYPHLVLKRKRAKEALEDRQKGYGRGMIVSGRK